MKKILKHRLFMALILFPLWGLGGCSKDDAPPITQENSFSCKINGELFVPKDYSSFPNSFSGIINYVSDSSDWTFVLSNGENTVYLYLHNVTQLGEYVLSESDGDGDFFGEELNLMEVDINNGTSYSSHKSTINSGVITVIELDMDNRIILKFDEIILSSINNNGRIVLTDGKLNINRETLNQ